MKLVCLNIWGGRAFGPLMDFIKQQSHDTDIFCFQEVYQSNSGVKESRETRVDILTDLRLALPDYQMLLAPIGSGYDNKGPVDFEVTESQAMFVRNTTISGIDSTGSVFVRGNLKKLSKGETLQDIPTNFQYMHFSVGEKRFVICNFHGMAYPGDKKDNPERLLQSQMIKNFLMREDGAKILCGDFNLLPDTQSIKMFEDNMINLIAKYKIERTRSKLTEWWGKEGFQSFADYMFVSPDVNVVKFSVPDVNVSDHLPMALIFS